MKLDKRLRQAAWLLTCVLMIWSSLAVAQDASGKDGTLAISGIDLTTNSAIGVPVDVVEKANYVYRIHGRQFKSFPQIDTRFEGKINGFYVKRAEHNNTAAAAGNYLPFGSEKKCAGSLIPFPASTREHWCESDEFSFRMYADAISNWNAGLLISHEFIHLRQYDEQPGMRVKGAPFWIVDGQANGIGYGMMEREKGFSRKAIALKTKGMKNANFSFFLGLRRYDVPLDIDRLKSLYPIDHPEYFREVNDPDGYLDMAGYMTGSFWRYVMRGRPQGFLAYKQMLRRPGPSNPTDSRAWLKWTDDGLKAATYGMRGSTVPIWRGGVRQVFSEMITELADFPDIVAKDRTGKLAAPYFDALLWTRSCQKIDLTTAPSASLKLMVHPYSAKCMRVKMPLDPAASGPDGPTPTPFSVSAAGNKGCEDLELGTRGQLLPQPDVFNAKAPGSGINCVLVWGAGFAPLRPNDPNGLRGWQTVLLINAPSNPDKSRTLEFLVNVVRPVAVSKLAGTRTVDRNDPAKKRKKPLPKLKGMPETQPVQPAIFEPEPDASCDPDEQAIFACGDVLGLSILSGDASTFARAGEVLVGGIAMQYPQPSFSQFGVKSLGELYQDGDAKMKATVAGLPMKLLGGTADGATITIAMKRLAVGETGSFPATIKVGAADRSIVGNDDELMSLSPKRVRTDTTGCIEVLSYQTNGKVQITVNNAGLLMGAASATLYEDNFDDEAACSTPMVPVGSVQVAFSTPGVFPVGPKGSYDMDASRAESYLLNMQDMIGQMGGPIAERSDIPAEDEADPSIRGQLAALSAGGGGAGGGDARCGGVPITAADRTAFIRALANGADGGDPATLAQMEQAMQAIGDAMLAVHVCDWIAAGRPATFEMKGSE